MKVFNCLLMVCAMSASGQEASSVTTRTNDPAASYTNRADAVVTNEMPAASTNAPDLRQEPAIESSNGATNPPSATGYDLPSFRIIAERNIFNPNRSPRREYGRRDSERETRPVRTESFGLLGTMTYEKGRFAFFDGSSSDYRRVVEPTQSIAGYTVTAVLPNAVTLQSTNGEQVQLAVGMQMRRRDEEPWHLSSERSFERSSYASSSTSVLSGGASASSGSSVVNGSSNSTAAAAEPGGGDAESEVLKRLLQKREQELNK